MNFDDSKICWVSASEESMNRVDVLVWALTTIDLNPYEKRASLVVENSSFASLLGDNFWSQIGLLSKAKNFFSRNRFR
jgi:hypothetical protein